MAPVFVCGGFDDLRSTHVRFLQEASRRGLLHVLLRTDDALKAETGVLPRFGFAERKYFLEAVRFVHEVVAAPAGLEPDSLPDPVAAPGAIWAATSAVGPVSEHPTPAKKEWCAAHGLQFLEIGPAELSGFPVDTDVSPPALSAPEAVPRALATGSFDWLHTGHVRFFEEAAEFGELTIVVGHDANIRLLKGDGHPRFPQEERRYMVAAMRSVAHALISTGAGWMDAEPELRMLAPRWYIVNEDGDKPEKREYCRDHGIEYVVLNRTPREGLPRRASTDLRGF